MDVDQRGQGWRASAAGDGARALTQTTQTTQTTQHCEAASHRLAPQLTHKARPGGLRLQRPPQHCQSNEHMIEWLSK